MYISSNLLDNSIQTKTLITKITWINIRINMINMISVSESN